MSRRREYNKIEKLELFDFKKLYFLYVNFDSVTVKNFYNKKVKFFHMRAPSFQILVYNSNYFKQVVDSIAFIISLVKLLFKLLY